MKTNDTTLAELEVRIGRIEATVEEMRQGIPELLRVLDPMTDEERADFWRGVAGRLREVQR